MNKDSKKYDIMWKDHIYIWLEHLNVMGRKKQSWKALFRILPRRTSQPSKAGQHSNSGNTENTAKVLLEKSNPETHNHQIHQGWNEGKNAKGSWRERLGYPKREAHQTQQQISQQKPYNSKESGGQYSTALKKRTFNPEFHIQPN